MGVKQGCPFSATLFGLFVDGLEQHLMDTLGMMHLYSLDTNSTSATCRWPHHHVQHQQDYSTAAHTQPGKDGAKA